MPVHNTQNIKYGTLATWLRMIASALKDRNKDIHGLLKRANIPPELLQQPDARIPDSQLRQLYQLAAEACETDEIGLLLARYVKATTFHALGFGMLSSNTVYDALRRFTRYGQMISDSAASELTQVGRNYRLSVNSLYDEDGHAFIPDDAFVTAIASVINFLRNISNNDLKPAQVSFTLPTPKNTENYQEFFKCDINFNAEQNFIEFEPHTVELEIESANESLARHQDQLAQSHIDQINNEFDKQVFQYIIEHIRSGGITVERLADSMNMRLRNLQHKLQRCNTSYQQLFDKARQLLATAFLQDQSKSITDIAFLLGFSNSASFTRAFKRWNDISPTQYRQQLKENLSVNT